MTLTIKYLKLDQVVLSKVNRLSKDKEIQQAFRTNLRATTDFTRVFLSRSRSKDFKILVIVSKKVYKKAYKRFRIRRKIVAIFQDLYSKNKLPKDLAVVIQVTNKQVLHKNKDEIEKDLLPVVFNLYQKMLAKQNNNKPK